MQVLRELLCCFRVINGLFCVRFAPQFCLLFGQLLFISGDLRCSLDLDLHHCLNFAFVVSCPHDHPDHSLRATGSVKQPPDCESHKFRKAFPISSTRTQNVPMLLRVKDIKLNVNLFFELFFSYTDGGVEEKDEVHLIVTIYKCTNIFILGLRVFRIVLENAFLFSFVFFFFCSNNRFFVLFPWASNPCRLKEFSYAHVSITYPNVEPAVVLRFVRSTPTLATSHPNVHVLRSQCGPLNPSAH